MQIDNPLEMQTWLEREFVEVEVAKALMECGDDKASGPDGFKFASI